MMRTGRQENAAATKPAPVAAWSVVGVLAIGPLLWASLAGSGVSFQSAGDALGTLGHATGLLGLSLLLVTLALAIRVPGLDPVLGGLLRLWHVHHWLGAGSLLLLMLHPVLLALAAAPVPAATLAVLTPPWQEWAVWSGWGALLMMMVFLAPSFSFFGRPDYQRWKFLHRLSIVAAALGLAHALPLSRAVPAEHAPWLWGGYGLLAGAAFAWRLGLSRLLSRRRYRIAAVNKLAAGVVELTLDGPPIEHQAGQFVYMSPLDPALPAGRGEEHPYALSSAPGEPAPRIAVKDLGDASHALMNVAPGTDVLIEGPYGRFLPEQYQQPALWIGGGIGLTPFVSAVRSMAADGNESVDVALVYCANDPSRAYFLDELHRIAGSRPGLRITPHYFAEHGPLDVAFLDQHVPDFRQRTVYVCGPQALIELVHDRLPRAGVPGSRINTEEFDLL